MKKLLLSFLMAAAPLVLLSACASPTTVCANEPGGNLTLSGGEHVASDCSFAGQTTIMITANATCFSMTGGTVEGGLLKFQLAPSIWHVTIEVRGVSFGHVSGGGAILLSGDSMKPIVNSKITIADCTFRNIVAPGLPGVSKAVSMSGGLRSSAFTVNNNSFNSEIDFPNYMETFIAQGRWYTSNMTISDNIVNIVTLSETAYGGRMGFVASYAMRGLSVTFRRNNYTATGPTEDDDGHRGIMYFETGRDWSIPVLDDYTGVSEHELRTTFGKGEIVVEDNVFSSSEMDFSISTQYAINVFFNGNNITGDGATQSTYVSIRPYRMLPSIIEVIGNTITTPRYRGYISLEGMLAAHSKALIEGNTIRPADGSAAAIQLHGVSYDPFAVADDTVSVAINKNVVHEGTASVGKFFIKNENTKPADVPNWPGVAVCGNTFNGAVLKTDAQIAAATDRGGRDASELIAFAPVATTCLIVRENGAASLVGSGFLKMVAAVPILISFVLFVL